LVLFAARAVFAQPIAFVHVHLIPMDRERVEADQTVIVRGDRIDAIGASGSIAVPTETTVIDGSGRYLLPGLTERSPPEHGGIRAPRPAHRRARQ
jgi:imidazolonepropionase-like amidohydrolase